MEAWLVTNTKLQISRCCDGCQKFNPIEPHKSDDKHSCEFPEVWLKRAVDGLVPEKPEFIEIQGLKISCTKKQAYFAHQMG